MSEHLPFLSFYFIYIALCLVATQWFIWSVRKDLRKLNDELLADINELTTPPKRYHE